jgi:ABC-2 type transport system permease protein
LLLLTNLSYNNFGAEGRGMQFFFASPVGFRQIMAGKNLAHATIFCLEAALVWMGTCLLYRPPSLWVTLATIAAFLFILPLDLTVGNLLSLYSPTRIDAGVFGRQRASLTTVLASFAVRGLLFGAGAWLFGWSRRQDNPATAVLIFLLPAVIAFAIYTWALSRVDRVALEHRESLISALGLE